MLNQIGSGLSEIFGKLNFDEVVFVLTEYSWVILVMIVGYTIHMLPSKWKAWYRAKFADMPLVLHGIVAFVVIVLLIQIKDADMQPFIYFQF
jgi:hypothetical protein